LDVQVGLGAVAGVSALADGVSGLNRLPRANPDSALPQMCKQHEGAVGACGDHHVIPGHGPNALTDPFCLAQHVGHERELGTAAFMVWLAVQNSDHGPGQGSEDRQPEADERFRAFRRDEGAPRTGRGPAGVIDCDEIDGVGSPKSVASMARHPACRTVFHPPASAERQVEYNCGILWRPREIPARHDPMVLDSWVQGNGWQEISRLGGA
jgi:hypothetical protein